MPKTIGPRGELIFQFGAGDLICEVNPCPGQHCELAIGEAPSGEAHKPGERCFDAVTVPAVLLRFPNLAMLQLYVEMLITGVREQVPKPAGTRPWTDDGALAVLRCWRDGPFCEALHDQEAIA